MSPLLRTDAEAAPGLPPANPVQPDAPSPRPTVRQRLSKVWRSVTPFGRTVAFASVACVVLALACGWEEFAVLGAAGIIALVIGVAMLSIGGSDLSVELGLDAKRVTVGDDANTNVAASNPSTRRTFPVRLEAVVGQRIARVDVPALGGGAVHREDFAIPTARRSVVPVGPVRSVQGDPLGLVRREIVWTGTEHLYIHPKTVRLGSLATGWLRDLEGQTTNDRSPSDVAFHTLREYVVGDDRRHIHWKTTARQADGKLMVREFVDTRRASLGLVLSLRAEDYATGDEFELAVSAAASLGARSLLDEQDVVLVGGDRMLPAFHVANFLDALSGVDVRVNDIDVGVATGRRQAVLGGASVVAILVGSTSDPAIARRAADRLGPSVRTVIIRSEDGGKSALRTSAGTPVVDLGKLEDLPGLLWAVSNL